MQRAVQEETFPKNAFAHGARFLSRSETRSIPDGHDHFQPDEIERVVYADDQAAGAVGAPAETARPKRQCPRLRPSQPQPDTNLNWADA